MEHHLDVSLLEPCEPMERILTAIKDLPEGDYLRVIHRREPYPIYPMLEQAGFVWRTESCGPSEFRIFIWRRGDVAAETSVPREEN